MDTTAALPSFKRQKLLIGQSANDIISNLPDDVIHYILSFLPTKDVIRTSILSKRWLYQWTYISNIDIDESSEFFKKSSQNLEMQNSFLHLMDRAFIYRGAYHIQKFRLSLAMRVSGYRVCYWIHAAVSHRIQELDLSIMVEPPIILPESLFTSESLSTLKLETDCVLKVPHSVCLSNLKNLHLLLVTFENEHSTQLLFSGCPVLQELYLYNCFWENIKSITISLPKLRKLSIYYDPCSWDQLLDCEVKIYAANLASFRCTSYLIVDLSLCNLHSLVDAYIEVVNWRTSMQERAALRAVNLVHGICSVKSLKLSNDTLECLSIAENLQARLPTFYHLTDLEVDLGCSDYINEGLMHFIQKSPNLISLEIAKGLYPDTYIIVEDMILNVVPHCLKSSLKIFTMSNFKGDPTEIKLLNYLFKNAIVLEMARVFCLEYFLDSLEKQKEISNQLQLLRTGLKSCMIEFL